MHLGNTADPAGSWLPLSSTHGLTCSNTDQSAELRLFVLTHLTCHRFSQDTISRQLGPGPSIECAGLAATGRAASPDSLKLASRPSRSLSTAFTLVQLRSLLQSPCRQANFIPIQIECI